MMDHPSSVTVIGAVNMDLSGTPAGPLLPWDSNPGRISLSPGGVGRNIAENLLRLGYDVTLITLLGEDAYGRLIREHCETIGLRLITVPAAPGSRTSAYLCVNELNGDLHTAVADMEIYEQMTPEALAPFLPRINASAMAVMDANLPEETLVWLSRNITVPLAADPVSSAKVGRLRRALPRISLIQPNVPEAEILSGISIRSDLDLSVAAEVLLRQGVRQVFISLGPRGVYADDGTVRGILPCFPGEIRNTTGCGDAFLAAAADAWMEGLDLMHAAGRALAAAAHCAADPRAVSPALSREVLEKMTAAVS